MKYFLLKFICWSEHFGIRRNERNSRSSRRTRRELYQFLAWIDRMVLKEAGKWFSGRVQEQRSMSALDQLLVRFVKEEIHPIFSIAMR